MCASSEHSRRTYLTTSIGVVSSYSTEGFALLKTSTGGAISFSIEGLALFPTSRAGGNSLSITGVALSLRIGSFESPTISENPNLWLIGVGLRMIGLISGTPRTTRRKGVGAARTVVENANNGSKMIVECMTGEGGYDMEVTKKDCFRQILGCVVVFQHNIWKLAAHGSIFGNVNSRIGLWDCQCLGCAYCY